MCNRENALVREEIAPPIKVTITTEKTNARRTYSQFSTARRLLAETLV